MHVALNEQTKNVPRNKVEGALGGTVLFGLPALTIAVDYKLIAKSVSMMRLKNY